MIVFVRHGEAAAGWGEHHDPGLSELGLKQAEAVADRLAAHDFKRILTSPMARCQQTSSPLGARLKLTPVIDERFSEIPTPDHVEDRVNWLQGLMAGRWSDAPPEVAEWRARLIDALNSLEPHTVIFSHFVAINAVIGHLHDRDDVIIFKPGHCSRTVLDGHGDTLSVSQLGSEAATRIL